ncbi:MAG: hypothetical protein U0X20_17065 [Caldilineaceae bacterium]
MHANSLITGNRPTSWNPIRRAKHPTNVIVQRSYGRRPSLEKLQNENKQLRQRLADLDLRMSLASNNPGSAIYPSIRDYLIVEDEYQKLEALHEAADDTQKPLIMKQLEALRPDLVAAQDTMLASLKQFVATRRQRRVPVVPMMTVQA